MATLNTPAQTRVSPRGLTAEERSGYDTNGFVVLPGVFGRGELADIGLEIDQIRARKDENQTRDGIFSLGLRSPVTQAVCQDDRILALIDEIVTPGIAVYSAKMIEKSAHDDRVCHWHQDNAYYNPFCLSQCRMSIWLPLQDTDESNGCLWVKPRTHLAQELQPVEDRSDTGSCGRSFADAHEAIEGSIPVRMEMGDLLLFHANLWHRSLGNGSDRPRRAFIISYQEATAPRGNGEQHKIIRSAA